MHVRYFGWLILKGEFILAEVDRTAGVGYPMGSALTSPLLECIQTSMPDNSYSLCTQFFASGSEMGLFL